MKCKHRENVNECSRARCRAVAPKLRKYPSETWKMYFFRLLFPTQAEALKWYADDHHWQGMLSDGRCSIAQDDGGVRAREALADLDWRYS